MDGSLPIRPRETTVAGVTLTADLESRPLLIDGCDTLPKLFLKRTAELKSQTAHREKQFGVWESFTWGDYLDAARAIGLGLKALGVKRGEVVSILSEDRREWLYADLGIQGVGAIASGVYTTDSAAQLAYIVNDSGTRVLFVENDEQLDKVLVARREMPGLAKVVVFDREGLHDFADADVMFLDDLIALGAAEHRRDPDAFARDVALSRPEDVALLIYTSGTTGPPKGAMITHENAVFVTISGMLARPTEAGDEQICFLPLCHVYERFSSVYFPLVARAKVSFAESPTTVFDDVREVAPTVFTGVPRVWEKVYSRLAVLTQEATPLGRVAFRAAVGIGLKRAAYTLEGKAVPLPIALGYALADALVLKNVRRMIGMHRVRRGNSGAAPISPELLRWYHAIGVPLYEGYGQTETSVLTSVNVEGANKVGTVGRPVPGTRVRIAPDGEIQVSGGQVFKGYWMKPDKTAETFTADGWLRTGDVGEVDADGYVRITGRLKDIIITAGGKNITPSEIENELKFSPYVADAVVIGDRRKYLTCLIMIDQENVEKFAQGKRVPFNDFRSLCAAKDVRELIGGVVEAANAKFARVEQVKDFRIIDMLLTAEDEELTPTMKLKRSFVEKKYAALIDEMYR